MPSVSVPGVHSWGNLHYTLVLGALGLSPSHGDALGRLFYSAMGYGYASSYINKLSKLYRRGKK
jgi:hypothetical protein